MIRRLWREHKKLFIVTSLFLSPAVLGLALLILPFVIGGLAAIVVNKKINKPKIKYSLLAIILLPTIFIGSVWFYGAMSSSAQNQKFAEETTIKPTKNIEQTSDLEKQLAPTVTPSPTPTLTPTPSVTPKPTATLKPTPVATKIPTPTVKPTTTSSYQSGSSTNTYIAPTQLPINSGGSYSCNCSKTCTQISSCGEAQYLLNVCGCSARDGDHDGIACDSAPLNCQN